MDARPAAGKRAWTQGELIVAALLGGAVMLLVEVRFEHREVLGETWHAWLPLLYSAALVVVGGAALIRFRRGGRFVLAALFGLAFAIGALGLWFHSDGHPVRALVQVVHAWLIPFGNDGGVKIGSQPPALAPAAFMGLGLIGLVACRKG
jgi:hypothetical protein